MYARASLVLSLQRSRRMSVSGDLNWRFVQGIGGAFREAIRFAATGGVETPRLMH